jgi:molybdenum cofactor cytidylyltransferase
LPDRIAAIVLAAGFSRRFGSDKLLHPLTLNGRTLPLAAHSLLSWLEVFDRVCVVTRPGARTFADALDASRISWVVCEHADRGMAESLACGIRATIGAAGWLIGLADMPRVPASAIAGVKDALIEGAPLAAASRNGRLGHPVGFSSRYLDELLALKGDAGARHILERDDVRRVEAESDGIFADIDQPLDLNRFIAHS